LGRKGDYETLVKVIDAFREKNTWRQTDLARRAGVGVPAIKRLLKELESSQMRLERFEEGPNEVHWSVPRDWQPGGVYLRDEQMELLVYAVAQLPKTELRDAVLERAALSRILDAEVVARLQEVVLTPVAKVEATLQVLFKAATTRRALHCHYHTAWSGRRRWRHLSVHRILPGPRSRVLAACHESGRLKWFRVSSMLEAVIDPEVAFMSFSPEEVEATLAASMGGFHRDGPIHELTFLVVGSSVEWVRNNLLAEMEAEDVPEGLRVRARTAAVDAVARYVIGLGGAARPEHPELARAVLTIAEAARDAAEECLREADPLQDPDA
jgi:hypothetical protein